MSISFKSLCATIGRAHPDNIRSHRLCERLGAVHDPGTPQIDPPERVYRHHAGAV